MLALARERGGAAEEWSLGGRSRGRVILGRAGVPAARTLCPTASLDWGRGVQRQSTAAWLEEGPPRPQIARGEGRPSGPTKCWETAPAVCAYVTRWDPRLRRGEEAPCGNRWGILAVPAASLWRRSRRGGWYFLFAFIFHSQSSCFITTCFINLLFYNSDAFVFCR